MQNTVDGICWTQPRWPRWLVSFPQLKWVHIVVLDVNKLLDPFLFRRECGVIVCRTDVGAHPKTEGS